MSSEDIVSQAPPPPDARISYGNDLLQFADVYLPTGNGPCPLVLLIRGAFCRAKSALAHPGNLCPGLAKARIAPAGIESRRVGNPSGGWPGSLEDVEAA